MKKKFGQNLSLLLVVICAILGALFVSNFSAFFTAQTSRAELSSSAFQEEVLQNGSLQTSTEENGLKISLTANARLTNPGWQISKKTLTQNAGELEYYFFKWRDLDNFTINVSNTSSEKQIASYNLYATYVPADYSLEENLNTPVEFGASGTKFQVLVSGNSFALDENLSFTYYIDQKTFGDNQGVACGYGFGAYKFDFLYVYQEDGHMVAEFMTILVAVVPDDITEAVTKARENGTILENTLMSPRELLNTYKLTFSSDAFTYVNPEYLQWQVVGTSIDKKKYVLYKAMCDENPETYAGYFYLNEDSDGTTGNSFVFDSKGVEGTWTVSVKVKGTDFALVSPELSTIAVPKPSLWWIWLLIAIAIALGIGGIVFLAIFIQKKREKVW